MSDNFIDIGPIIGGRITYAANDPSLSGDMPESFSHAPPMTQHFNDAGDPLAKASREAMDKSERERREESGVPRMVKLHKPFPELKPEHERAQGPQRTRFNNDWLKEQRDMRLAEFADEREIYEAREREAMAANHYSDNIHTYSEPSR